MSPGAGQGQLWVIWEGQPQGLLSLDWGLVPPAGSPQYMVLGELSLGDMHGTLEAACRWRMSPDGFRCDPNPSWVPEGLVQDAPLCAAM